MLRRTKVQHDDEMGMGHDGWRAQMWIITIPYTTHRCDYGHAFVYDVLTIYTYSCMYGRAASKVVVDANGVF